MPPLGLTIHHPKTNAKPVISFYEVAGFVHFNPIKTPMKPTLIKLIILICLVTSSPLAKAGWFDNNIDEYRDRLSRAEQELSIQRRNADVWASVSGTLGVGCVLLLIIGTALGAKVRRHHATKP